MGKIKIEYLPGTTPLDPNELNGLIPDYITTQGELNILEKANILEAQLWALGRKHQDVLSVSFVHSLHKKMFNQVWRWAGVARKSDKNIGVPWDQVSSQLDQLLKNTQHWIKVEVYSWDEIGARFHHQLVSVHVFPNGNGRHARLITEILLEKYGQELFTWGLINSASSIDAEGRLREEYLASLREADSNQFSRLINFVRS